MKICQTQFISHYHIHIIGTATSTTTINAITTNEQTKPLLSQDCQYFTFGFLSLSFAVIPQTPEILPNSSSLTDGDPLSLYCYTASGSFTPMSSVWNINNIDQGPPTTNLLEQLVSVASGTTDYKCKVSSDGGTYYSSYSVIYTPVGEQQKLFYWNMKNDIFNI